MKKLSSSDKNKYADLYVMCENILHFFVAQYLAKFNKHPEINFAKDKFKIKDLLLTSSDSVIIDNIKYYISIESYPSLDDFVYNFNEIKELKEKVEEDRIQRNKMLEKTKLRVKEFRNEQ